MEAVLSLQECWARGRRDGIREFAVIFDHWKWEMEIENCFIALLVQFDSYFDYRILSLSSPKLHYLHFHLRLTFKLCQIEAIKTRNLFNKIDYVKLSNQLMQMLSDFRFLMHYVLDLKLLNSLILPFTLNFNFLWS